MGSLYTTHVVKQFDRKSCTYYNPLLAGKNGGPNPNKAQRGMRQLANGKWIKRPDRRRNRREEEEDGTEEELEEDFENGCDGTEEGFAAELCADELVEVSTVEGRRKKNKKKKV